MTRLFIRFYVGVVIILVVAWLVQAYIANLSSTQNVNVVENALGGGVRLARDQVESFWNEDLAISTSNYLQIAGKFDYPMDLKSFNDATWLEDPYRQRLIDGEVVLLRDYLGIAVFPQPKPEKSIADELDSSWRGDSQSMTEAASQRETANQSDSERQADAERRTIKSADPEYFLLFGPLPQFVGPSPVQVTLGYGIIFLLAALAIAILLRPVAKQFRAVERTATSIAGGDLNARIPTKSRSQDLALVTAFNSMADRTESLVRSQRELLQAVSHELRTPLARIRFATDLIETAKNEDERRNRLNSIDDATEKLDSLVGELLTYARIDSNASEMPSEIVNVWNLVEEAVDFHAPLYPHIKYTLPADPARLITRAHSASLARAIENLVSNGGQHAKSRVMLSAKTIEQAVLIKIEDDGNGIPEDQWETVFEPFMRLNQGDNRGVGLGLALVQRITKQHKGEVSVSKSTLGGACLTIQLPHHSGSTED
ncbi:MAG: two-component sensor histidine kinase [Rhodopirellula sp.]|nr:two-component sensor histidine kinase [Rhodopirellula sp.]